MSAPVTDFNVVKKPHAKIDYTQEQLRELVTCSEDPMYYMTRFMRVRHPVLGALPFNPYSFQTRLVEAFHKHRFNIVLAGRQLGKALALDTPLPTPTGWTTMGEVAVGDQLLDENGLPTTVQFATDVMKGHDCYEVVFDNGERVVADRDHLWAVGLRDGSETIVCTTHAIAALLKQAEGAGLSVFIARVDPKGRSKTTKFFFETIKRTASVPVRCIQVDNPSSLFLCSRSMIPTHNTEVTQGYLLWRAMFVPDSTILITANTFNQALEIMDRVRYWYENVPDHIRDGVREYNKGNIVFANGSRIIARATTPNSGRGLSISVLYVDEFAAIHPNMATAFWTAIRPTLSAGGSCIITSTPQNDEDQFASLWRDAVDNVDAYGNTLPDGVGRNGFYANLVPWHEHPDRDEAWAENERASIGPARFAQEHNCEFVTSQDTLINPLVLTKLRHIEPIFYTGTVRWFYEPDPNHAFLVGLDPSLGTDNDYSAIQVYQLPEMIQVAEWRHNRTDPRRQVTMLLEVLYALEGILMEKPQQLGAPEIYWTFENNAIGDSILQIIEDTGEERFPGNLVTERRRRGQPNKRVRKGLNTTNRNRLSALARLKTLIETERMTVNSHAMVKELKNFITTGTTFRAKPGEHDDLVMATVLIVRMIDIVLAWGTHAGSLRDYISDDEFAGEEVEPLPVVV